MLCIYPKDIFPKGEFPSDNVHSIFLDVQFLKRQLPKFRPVCPFDAPQAAMRGGAAARTAFGNCRLEIVHLGSYHSRKYPWDVDAGKKPSRKYLKLISEPRREGCSGCLGFNA